MTCGNTTTASQLLKYVFVGTARNDVCTTLISISELFVSDYCGYTLAELRVNCGVTKGKMKHCVLQSNFIEHALL